LLIASLETLFLTFSGYEFCSCVPVLSIPALSITPNFIISKNIDAYKQNCT